MKKHQYFVYLLKCSDDTIYVGVTNSIKRRFKEHQSGCNPTSYTASRLPVELFYVEEFKCIIDAIRREKQIKNWSRKKKIALKMEPEMLREFSKKVFGIPRLGTF